MFLLKKQTISGEAFPQIHVFYRCPRKLKNTSLKNMTDSGILRQIGIWHIGDTGDIEICNPLNTSYDICIHSKATAPQLSHTSIFPHYRHQNPQPNRCVRLLSRSMAPSAGP